MYWPFILHSLTWRSSAPDTISGNVGWKHTQLTPRSWPSSTCFTTASVCPNSSGDPGVLRWSRPPGPGATFFFLKPQTQKHRYHYQHQFKHIMLVLNLCYWLEFLCTLKGMFLTHNMLCGAATVCPAPLLPLWAPKHLAPSSWPHRSSRFPVNTFPRSPLQLPDALTPRWVKRPGTLTFWPWKWCPSHVWRGLPLCQF